MEKEQYFAILNKYLEGRASAEEEAFLYAYYKLFMADADILELLDAREKEKLKLEIKAGIELKLNKQAQIISRPLWTKLRIARAATLVAAAVATIIFGVWFFAYRELASSLTPRNDDWAKNDVAPGKSGATITLASGEVIALSGAKKGVIIDPTSMTYDDGSKIASQARNDEMQKMTASTAKGQTYEFTLPDGTHVWLNADSKISFPSQFSGKQRKILLSGEGYFEVAKDKNRPFVVESKGQEITVLGTHFNINAYTDEPESRTTLLEGSVKVSKQGQSLVMKANQVAINNARYRIELKETLDAERAIAWRNGARGAGELYFENESLGATMRKLARWYNVEIVYQMKHMKEEDGFYGSISKDLPLSKVLRFLENTQTYHFKIEGRKIIVTD